jgi:hypothetical protein
VGFYPEYLTAFHYQDAIAAHRKTVYRLIKAGDEESRHQNKRQKYITSIKDLKLSCV